MKDLEVMMQNLIMSAFDTVITVEDGVNILEVFMHAAVREVGINVLLLTKASNAEQIWFDPDVDDRQIMKIDIEDEALIWKIYIFRA